ncbi:FRG domain-containing protein [Tabrizicola sp.]|uniref:FRG domain-containing protein n=1 Tax=Tabrizicola sp. TaxID=2005166 RepID=UPI003F3E526D
MDPSVFWTRYEETAKDYDELHAKIVLISEAAIRAERTLVWRGQKDATWALHSKLYRNYLARRPSRVTENAFAELEKTILRDLRRWGLHSQRNSGRLSILSQLAMLQHFGSPTRLLDITFNALVGAFFATEKDSAHETSDARLFAIDVTDRLINETKSLRNWEDSLDIPWSDSFILTQYYDLERRGHSGLTVFRRNFMIDWLHEWSSHFYAWRPPSLDARIAAQNGGFIFGGIVGTSLREGYLDSALEVRHAGFQLTHPSDPSSRLTIDETRRITCIAVQPKPFPTKSIRENTKNSIYSIRITSKGKKEIQSKLMQIYGYTHSTIYPDFPGFSLYGEGTT